MPITSDYFFEREGLNSKIINNEIISTNCFGFNSSLQLSSNPRKTLKMKLLNITILFVLSSTSADLFSSCCRSYRQAVPKPIHTRYHPKVTKVAHYEKALQREYQLGGRNIRKINLLKQRILKEKPDYDPSSFFTRNSKTNRRRIDERTIRIAEDKIRGSIDRLAKAILVSSATGSKNGLPHSTNFYERRQFLSFVNTERRKIGKELWTMDDLMSQASQVTQVLKEERQANLRQAETEREEALRRLNQRVAPLESINFPIHEEPLLSDGRDKVTEVVTLHPEAEKKIRSVYAAFNRMIVEVSSKVRKEFQCFAGELQITRV